MSYRILVVNPGSTSTKIGVYEDENLLFDKTLRHSAEELEKFDSIPAQKDWRRKLVMKALEDQGFDVKTLSAVSGRGGLLRPIRGGTYAVNDNMVKDCTIGVQGQHASNLGGLISPFVGEMLRGEADYKIIAVEPASCPSLTRGVFKYDFCDTGMVCPLAKMYTLGSGFIPSPNHAGGLRYHGMSSILSQLYHDGLIEARSVEQTRVFEAAELFARGEGTLPAPESSHAISAAIDEALKCKGTGEEKTIVFGLTGTGYFDMVAYEKFHDGQMSDYIPTDADLQKGFDGIPQFPGNEL